MLHKKNSLDLVAHGIVKSRMALFPTKKIKPQKATTMKEEEYLRCMEILNEIKNKH